MNDIPPGIPVASAWSLFAGEAGKACIWSAIAFFLIAALLWVLRPKSKALEAPARLTFILGSVSLFLAYGLLTLLFVKDQFQYQLPFEHGDSLTALKYKIAGVWTANQGSLLLWACTSALFGLFALRGTGPYRRWYSVAFCVFLGTIAATLAYETPFDLLPMAQAHGKIFVLPHGLGMTPALQNYWVVIHPPTIFTGFGILSVFFGYAFSAMLTPKETDWVQRVRPWALLAVGVLGLGVCMGGLWAYETLNWGGFWAWDPVEIASFIPWLFTVVFVHGILVQVNRNKWVKSNLLLGGLPFLSFVYGTFLTRSGLLDGASNHSFVAMNGHAVVILRWFMFLVTFGYLGLWIWASPRVAAAAPKPEAETAGATREGFYRFGMMLISMLAVVIMLGMSWPVIVALRGGEGKAVEEWLYHQVVVWFFLPAMLLMAVAPFVSWRAMPWKELWNRVANVLCIAIGLTGFLQLALMSPSIGVHALPGATVAAPFHHRISLPFWMLVLTFACVFVIVANVWRIVELTRRSPLGIGGFVAHLGLAILLGGLIISRGYEQKQDLFVRDGSPASALGYIVSYKGKTNLDPRDRNGRVFFDVRSPDGDTFEADPGLYEYGSPGEDPKQMVWPSIQHYPSHDVYLAMAPPQVEAWQNPVEFLPGQKQTINGTTVEYIRPTRHGQPGTVGVTFGALVRLTELGDDGELHQYTAEPAVQFTGDGLDPTLPQIGPDYRIAMVGGMDASSHGVQLLLLFSPAIYPLELFYKPLTSLVWLGMIVMTGGGLMSAYSRRRVAVKERAKAKARATAPRLAAGEVT